MAKQIAGRAAATRRATGKCGHRGPKTRPVAAEQTVSASDGPHSTSVRQRQAFGTSGGVVHGAPGLVITFFGGSSKRGPPVPTRCVLKRLTRRARPLRAMPLRKLPQQPRRVPSGGCASFLAVTRLSNHMLRRARGGPAMVSKQWVDSGAAGFCRAPRSPHCFFDHWVIK